MPIITFKVTEQQKMDLDAVCGANQSQYIRDAVFRQVEQSERLDRIEYRLFDLERTVGRLANRLDKAHAKPDAPVKADVSPEVMGMLAEVVLQLRGIIQPGKTTSAIASVKQAGWPALSIR
ncbi:MULTISPECIES: hypothetical protein [Komagataeibacter]|uniref:Uncharacterized protein n=1 Tax=Komagataeibacter xylinus TaxID=28448 RepID=A0A857FU43_KOMXY|nr:MULTISPECIES: hypothetical protein [Komagataeibacter]QHC36034.1 hypothetical protein FMA36_11500 [Komagataeibacter xylinus]GCE89834.1 hypothetical protein MSKU15_1435 [Komagataeibacter diospyri]